MEKKLDFLLLERECVSYAYRTIVLGSTQFLFSQAHNWKGVLLQDVSDLI